MSCMYKCKHMLQLDPCNNGRQDGKEDKEKSHQGDNIHCQPSREYLNHLPRLFSYYFQHKVTQEMFIMATIVM